MTPRLWALLIAVLLIAGASGAATWFLFAGPRVAAAENAKAEMQARLDAANVRVKELEIGLSIAQTADQISSEESAKASAERTAILARLNQIRSRIDVIAEEQDDAFRACLDLPVRAFHDRLRQGDREAGAGDAVD